MAATVPAEGNRLGLAIVQPIVKPVTEQHGGQVSVESVQDQGSCFHVLLPLLAGAEYALPEPATTNSEQSNTTQVERS